MLPSAAAAAVTSRVRWVWQAVSPLEYRGHVATSSFSFFPSSPAARTANQNIPWFSSAFSLCLAASILSPFSLHFFSIAAIFL
jgi:hypothetical protein